MWKREEEGEKEGHNLAEEDTQGRKAARDGLRGGEGKNMEIENLCMMEKEDKGGGNKTKRGVMMVGGVGGGVGINKS